MFYVHFNLGYLLPWKSKGNKFYTYFVILQITQASSTESALTQNVQMSKTQLPETKME